MDKCLRCGAPNPELGVLLVKGSTSWDIRFRRDGAWSFSRKDPVRAVACRACGHIELVLAAVAGRPADAAPQENA